MFGVMDYWAQAVFNLLKLFVTRHKKNDKRDDPDLNPTHTHPDLTSQYPKQDGFKEINHMR